MLTDIKIIDLSRVLAGPLCTMMLADLGASVIKVERPGTGDETRSWGPPFDDRGESAYYLSVNRNKMSVAMDFDHEPDRELLFRLIGDADVVVDNFRPGTLERRGIDAEKLLGANPSLVWCTISGFGEASDRAGYDLAIQAECGWMSITGEPAGAPMRAAVAFADILAGKDAAIAILAALVAPRPANRRLHISLLASATAALTNVAQNVLVSGVDAKRWGNQHPNLVPYQLFDAADRPVIIAVGTDPQWKACTQTLGLDELAADASLAMNTGRIAARERIIAEIASMAAQRPAQDLIDRLNAAGVPCGVVNSVLEALQNIGCSPLTGVAPSVPGTVRMPPPRLDEQGVSIRRSGWSVFT
ncbi:MAG: CoA transferase [Gemmatimonadaceae bacterium]